MPKVAIQSLAEARSAPPPEVYQGPSRSLVYFDGGQDPLHLHLLELAAGEELRIRQSDTDRLAYVWQGRVDVGDIALNEGSSLIVEHGQSLQLSGGAEKSLILVFAAGSPAVQSRPGGNVHLLPRERVPRTELREGVSGGMHADSACPTCELWLHENRFASEEQPSNAGIHSHSEDEIIFVTDGGLQFGRTLYGPGTALAIAAETFYSFTPGPEGVGFVNFRACKPEDIKFRDGTSMSETGFWRERVSRPEYLHAAGSLDEQL